MAAAPTPATDAATFDWAFRLDVRSAFLLVGAVAPGMSERGWGRIVSVSSFVGQIGRPGLALCGARRAEDGEVPGDAEVVEDAGRLPARMGASGRAGPKGARLPRTGCSRSPG